jgi:hypothetical protein
MTSRPESPSPIRLSDLPLLVRFAVGLSFFSTWVIFEEGIVDRTGLWELMPGYVKARLCPWDLAALGIVLVPLLLLRSRRRPALA